MIVTGIIPYAAVQMFHGCHEIQEDKNSSSRNASWFEGLHNPISKVTLFLNKKAIVAFLTPKTLAEINPRSGR